MTDPIPDRFMLGEISERTKNTETRAERIESKLDAMSKTFVTKSEFNVWRAAVFAVFSFVFVAFMYAVFSGNVHLGH